MTVREAVFALPSNENILIAFNGTAREIDRHDALALDAYGDYLVESIRAFAINNAIDYELTLSQKPVKQDTVQRGIFILFGGRRRKPEKQERERV